jgi:hypothetical protein
MPFICSWNLQRRQTILPDPHPEPVAGAPSIDALISFLHFVGKAPLLAYNVPFVAAMIERTLAENLGIDLGLPWIDLAWVMPDLFRDVEHTGRGLDAWLDHFPSPASAVTTPFLTLTRRPSCCRSRLPVARAKVS